MSLFSVDIKATPDTPVKKVDKNLLQDRVLDILMTIRSTRYIFFFLTPFKMNFVVTDKHPVTNKPISPEWPFVEMDEKDVFSLNIYAHPDTQLKKISIALAVFALDAYFNHFERGSNKKQFAWALSSMYFDYSLLPENFKRNFPQQIISLLEGFVKRQAQSLSQKFEEALYQKLLQNLPRNGMCPNCGGSVSKKQSRQRKQSQQGQSGGQDKENQQKQQSSQQSQQGQCPFCQQGNQPNNQNSLNQQLVDYFQRNSKTFQKQDENTKAAFKEKLKQVYTFAKERGLVPGNAEEILDTIFGIKLPWDRLLEDALANLQVESEEKSWRFPNIYKLPIGYFPSRVKDEEGLQIALFIDTSGSMSTKDLKIALGIILSMKDYLNLQRLIVVQHDYRLTDVKVIDREDLDILSEDEIVKEIKIKGRGGTSHIEPWKDFKSYIERNEDIIESIYDIGMFIFFSDFYSDFEGLFEYELSKEGFPYLCIVSPQGRKPEIPNSKRIIMIDRDAREE